MPTSMDIGKVEVWNVLDLLGEMGVVWLSEDEVYQTLLSERIHDPWNEVSGQAFWRSRVVDHEG